MVNIDINGCDEVWVSGEPAGQLPRPQTLRARRVVREVPDHRRRGPDRRHLTDLAGVDVRSVAWE
jgi:hypothetical protein